MLDPELFRQLDAHGVPLDVAQRAALAGHLALLRQYQASISLVSHGDLPALEARHLADSLALAPWLRWAAPAVDAAPDARPQHLDIGSGGGFPAIPLAIALPERDFVLLERSQKKGDFLRLAAATLRLKNVRVLTGQFPADATGLLPATLTARAVEKPGRVWADILAYLPAASAFVCQFAGEAPALPPGVVECSPHAPETLAHLGSWQRGAVRIYRRSP